VRRDPELERRVKNAIAGWYAYGSKAMTSLENLADLERDKTVALAYVEAAFKEMKA
jgi:hypothetical protein